MSAQRASSAAVRRARPLLGTLVEIGLCAQPAADPMAACEAGFDAITEVQRCLSRFDAHSDIARFNALPGGDWLDVQSDTQIVLAAAQRLFIDSGGAFDVSLGSAPSGWALHGRRLHKLHADARLDLGGIGKGHAVDRAVLALQRVGVAGGWVNAGGDLRTFGAATVELKLRDEQRGGVVDFGRLQAGAFATSCFGTGARSQLCDARRDASTWSHVSVAAPSCLMADALTKVVAVSGDVEHPLLARAGAQAWLH